MKAIANCLMTHLAELVFVAGAACIAVGVGMIYFPAGLIAGGALAVAGSVISMFGAGDSA